MFCCSFKSICSNHSMWPFVAIYVPKVHGDIPPSLMVLFLLTFCVIWHFLSFDILCHFTFRVIWHFMSFDISLGLIVILVIIVIIVTKVILALMLTMRLYCWCAEAAYAADVLMHWCSEVLMLLMCWYCWYCWCSDAADVLMLLMRWCDLWCWCTNAVDALMLLILLILLMN